MILSYRLGYSCACILRDAIEEVTGKRLKVTCHHERILKLYIRYGNSDSVSCNDTEYNSPDFIRIAAHKLRFSQLLQPHGFDVPIFKQDIPTNDDFPLLIRQTMTGFSAAGIVICRNMDDFISNWNPRHYWTKFVYTSREYRVQVLGNKVGRLFRKECRNSVEDDLPVRNSYAGYHYALRTDLGKFDGLIELVNRVSEFLPGKFYGLDVGWRPDTRNYFLFEANSGYGVNINSALALANYLNEEEVFN